MCGTVDERQLPAGPKHAAPARTRNRKRTAGIAIAAAVTVAVVAGVFIARAWQADRVLDERAKEVSSEAAATVVDGGGGHGSDTAGNVAAGGIAALDSGVLYAASSQGVYCWDLSAEPGEDGDGLRELSSQGGYGLNVSEGRAYYLIPAAGGRDKFEGTAIRSLSCSSDTAAGPQSAKVEYTPKSAEARLSCLSISDGACYFLERMGASYSIMGKEPGSSASAEQLFAFEADRAWLFVEDGALYLAQCAQGAWSVGTVRGASGPMALTELAHGRGDLVTAALSGGKFYYALASDAGEAHMQCSDLKGGVTEFADVVNPVRIAVEGDVVAAATKSGHLVWLDAVTGVSRDVTDELDSLASSFVPATAALSVCGDYICIADDRGTYCWLSASGAHASRAI